MSLTTSNCVFDIDTLRRGQYRVDHLHEHFLDPAVVRNGRYVAPTSPGFGAQMRSGTLLDYRFPDGPVWTER
jgi:L-alanine-DL-glutamate epimerase-like enolase superfamily enzyme